MVRRNTISATTPAFCRLHAERLEARDTPSAGGLEDVLSLPHLPGMGNTYPTALQPVAPTVKAPLLEQVRGRYAVGTQGGGVAQVNVYDAKTGSLLGTLSPFGRYAGAVSVATGDVTGDGIEDIVVGAGKGLKPTVEIFDGATLRLLGGFDAYSVAFKGGVSVATGDVTGDGRADIVTGAGAGGGPHVKVFSGKDLFPTTAKMATTTPAAVRNFMAFDPTYRGGVTVAAGDLTGDGKAEIVIGKKSGPAEVAVWDSAPKGHRLFGIAPVGGSGASVAVGDVSGDGKADIVVGTVAGGKSVVQTYDAGGKLEASRVAYSGAGGVSVAVQDIDGDGKKEVLAGSGVGVAPRVKILNALTGTSKREFPAVGPWYTGGLSVG